MDLRRHAAVLWRFRAVTAAGLVLAVVLAVLASYRPVWDGGPGLERRGSDRWSSASSLLVTQPGFPEGRVVLPTPETGAATTSKPPAGAGKASGQDQFADPSRFMALADLYSQLLTSDLILDRTP